MKSRSRCLATGL